MATINGILSPPVRPEAENAPLSAKRKREDSIDDSHINGSSDSNNAKTVEDVQTLITDLVDVLKP